MAPQAGHGKAELALAVPIAIPIVVPKVPADCSRPSPAIEAAVKPVYAGPKENSPAGKCPWLRSAVLRR